MKKYLYLAIGLLGLSSVGNAQYAIPLYRDYGQAADAVFLRDYQDRHGYSHSDRQTVNGIIHSHDQYMHNGQSNPYYDTTDSYDPSAQAAMQNMANNYGVQLPSQK